MSAPQPLRVMWLLNHTSARKFEVPMLKRIGIEQIFLPKSYPAHPGFRTASVDFSEDPRLDIPKSDLQVLNAADWYAGASPDAWHIANQHFDLIFFILHQPEVLINAARYFRGSLLWRTYGLDASYSYGRLVRDLGLSRYFDRMGPRFFFGEAYRHLADAEPDYLKSRRVFLPLGLSNPSLLDNWEGSKRQIYFVCPDIQFNSYYRAIYKQFRENFNGIKCVIAGAQPIYVSDPEVTGYVSEEQHADNMAQSRVMFYHSQEPNHIHYHPFEAVRAGMPLIFMAGGMLDRLGGVNLPGRCSTVSEARRKIEQILADDWDLIEQLRSTQTVLLERMKPENCEAAWRAGFARIASGLADWRRIEATRPKFNTRKRIAVILPVGYRGGSLRGSIALARALYQGSRQWGEDAEVVLVHLDIPESYPEEEFADLPHSISRRLFTWKNLSASEARSAMRYAGFSHWEPVFDRYIAPDDGLRQLLDCDLWLIISDRLSIPVLPLKPMVLMVYDYLQRYEDLLSHGADIPFIAAARAAEKVMVTTEFTYNDAVQYAGIDPRNVSKVPMLAPEFQVQEIAREDSKNRHTYFVWTTNAASHKNHFNAAEALRIYYEELDGQLDCRITGVNTKGMLTSELPHLKAMAGVFERSRMLLRRVRWMGEVPDTQYRQVVSQASFMWHAGRVDNGTFSVIEAASLTVPSLSSDYPAMREIDTQFSLNLAWMDPDSPRKMAEQLKYMEREARTRCDQLSGLTAQGIDTHCSVYWGEIRGLL